MKLTIIFSIIIFGILANSQDKEVLQNFSSFYEYQKIVKPSSNPDEIARAFARDPVNGSVLVKHKATLKDFLSILDAYSQEHPNVKFQNPLNNDEYQNLLKAQNFKPAPPIQRKEAFIERGSEPKGCISGEKHPFYGNYQLNENHQTNFLDGFDPQSLPKMISKDPHAFADLLKPSDKSVPFNDEQVVKGRNFEMGKDDSDALNMNADLGLQYTIREILRPNILTVKDERGNEKPTFVIISSGHAIAGLAALAPMQKKNSDGTTTCLFDTSIYMPVGTWKETSRLNVATQGAAIWGQAIANSKKKCTNYAGGVAIALNGHRGDLDIFSPNEKAANINPINAFGTPDEFVKGLNKKGIGRVVIITETMADDPSKVNKLPLEILKEKDNFSFNFANRDLYEFLKAVQEKNIDVVVVSGEQRVDHCKNQTESPRNRTTPEVAK